MKPIRRLFWSPVSWRTERTRLQATGLTVVSSLLSHTLALSLPRSITLFQLFPPLTFDPDFLEGVKVHLDCDMSTFRHRGLLTAEHLAALLMPQQTEKLDFHLDKTTQELQVYSISSVLIYHAAIYPYMYIFIYVLTFMSLPPSLSPSLAHVP